MIDIALFSSLIEAIPSTARVFILGDKDQLPSVQAGAVLGELLTKKTESVAALKESSRFNDNSDVGRLKNAMQENEKLDKNLVFLKDWEGWKNGNTFTIQRDQNPVTTFSLEEKEQIPEVILRWSECFYDDLVTAVPSDFSNQDELDALWKKAVSARILCAERRGVRGVEEINERICKHIIKKHKISVPEKDGYFTGQLLMLTKNQTMFSLYNGDSGIVVEYNDLKYLMVQKELKEEDVQNDEINAGGIFRSGSYIFYPLYLLPRESITTAYAITIHKSQGSGYPAILIFLPEQKGHPLLNRQIAYTAITRTEGSTYIVASYETLEQARSTVIERDTMIDL